MKHFFSTCLNLISEAFFLSNHFSTYKISIKKLALVVSIVAVVKKSQKSKLEIIADPFTYFQNFTDLYSAIKIACYI